MFFHQWDIVENVLACYVTVIVRGKFGLLCRRVLMHQFTSVDPGLIHLYSDVFRVTRSVLVKIQIIFNLFIFSAPFIYPLKIPENLTVFGCFQWVEKGYIGNKWVKLLCNTSLYFSFISVNNFGPTFQFWPIFLVFIELIKRLMEGVQAHLQSPDTKVYLLFFLRFCFHLKSVSFKIIVSNIMGGLS